MKYRRKLPHHRMVGSVARTGNNAWYPVCLSIDTNSMDMMHIYFWLGDPVACSINKYKGTSMNKQFIMDASCVASTKHMAYHYCTRKARGYKNWGYEIKRYDHNKFERLIYTELAEFAKQKLKALKRERSGGKMIYCWSCKKPTMHTKDSDNGNTYRCNECLNYNE
jgi:hypothetical protein